MMVTVKITIERDGEPPIELTREQAEALYAELGTALGKGQQMPLGPLAPLPADPMPGFRPWTPPQGPTVGEPYRPYPPLRGTSGDPPPHSPWRITCKSEDDKLISLCPVEWGWR